MAQDNSKMSRRDLFRGAFLRASRATTPQEPAVERSTAIPTPRPMRALSLNLAIPLLRPPCAVDEPAFLAGCTRCNMCIDACPHDAIGLAPERYREAAGTPYIEPLADPCWMCPDTPCVAVCEPGVLSAQLPLKMADAVIQEHDCLAHQNTFCTLCLEQCPVEGALVFEENVPIIDQAICTGCGVCQHVCPAPVNAIMILPLRDRPSLPSTDEAPTLQPPPPVDGAEAGGGDDDDVPDPLRQRFMR